MWDTDSDKEVDLVSKKIDDKIIQKVNESTLKVSRKPGELQRSAEWAEYSSNVNALINQGFIEKVDND